MESDVTDRFGPADVICPYCKEEVHVEAGPTRRCEINHCGRWMVVDLVEGSSGHKGRVCTDGGVDGTDRRTDGEKLIDGLNKMIDDRTPDDEHWCPKCEKYAEFDVLQTVERPEFDAENDVIGCPDCRYTTIDATAWRSMGAGGER